MKRSPFPTGLQAKCQSLLRKFPKLRLMVAGDLILDEALYGDTERISREAPVLILRYLRTDAVPGGAANAANNASDLGAQVYPLGVVGEDEGGKNLLKRFKMKRMDTSGVVAVGNRPTTVKTRILAGAPQTAKQQVIRIDRVEEKAVSRAVEAKLIARVTALAPRMDALLISDYGLGVMTEPLRRSLLSAFEGRIVTVDSHDGFAAYRGASLVTPNLAEAGPAAGLEISGPEDVRRCGEILRKKVGSEVLITEGPQGMTLFDRKDSIVRLPVFGIDQPVDPTGAGDTVAVAATLSLAAGAGLVQAGWLATVAAGLVVAKRGTATVTPTEILGALKDR
jgi:rfaE bifunctional protein kinase chain/domain